MTTIRCSSSSKSLPIKNRRLKKQNPLIDLFADKTLPLITVIQRISLIRMCEPSFNFPIEEISPNVLISENPCDQRNQAVGFVSSSFAAFASLCAKNGLAEYCRLTAVSRDPPCERTSFCCHFNRCGRSRYQPPASAQYKPQPCAGGLEF